MVINDTFTWDQRHQLMDRALDADQSEREAIISGTVPAAIGIEDQRIAGYFDDDAADTDKGAAWLDAEGEVEVAVGVTLEELERRAQILGDAYPFAIDGSSLRYRGSYTGVYEFCLAISLAPALNARPYDKMPVVFERISTAAVQSYIGTTARGLRTGWPSHGPERPVRFKQLINNLHTETGEWWWAPVDPNPDDPDHRIVKDGGVDFVVWTPMLDFRPGQMFVLGQCACGANWDTKLDELSKDELEKWMRPVTAASFVRAFSIPRHIPGYHIFKECNGKAGITFDRARLALIAEHESKRDYFVTQGEQLDLARITRLSIPGYEHLRRNG